MSVTTLSDDQVATLTQRISSVENDIEQTKKGVDVAAKNELKYIEEKNQVLQDYWKRTREILVDEKSHLYENLKQLRDIETQLRQDSVTITETEAQTICNTIANKTQRFFENYGGRFGIAVAFFASIMWFFVYFFGTKDAPITTALFALFTAGVAIAIRFGR